jgi:hypothetical protein
MMASVGLQLDRRAPAPTGEELRRQLLALVLALVLVWYTFVVPANVVAGTYTRAAPDDEGLDGEVRGVGGRAETEPADDLDWPEYIYP